MKAQEEVERILADLKAVLGPRGNEMVSKISARIDEMTGEIEALKYANSLDAETGDILAAQPGFSKIHFTSNERTMLAYIIGRGSRISTKEGIYAALYATRFGGEQPDIKILDIHLCNIRRKLSKANLGCQIKTIHRQGYVYIPDPNMKRRDVLFISDHREAA